MAKYLNRVKGLIIFFIWKVEQKGQPEKRSIELPFQSVLLQYFHSVVHAPRTVEWNMQSDFKNTVSPSGDLCNNRSSIRLF